jgi:hypothetical protein
VSRPTKRRSVAGDQSGIGMVLVMGIGMLVLGMGFLAQRIFDGAINSSSGHVRSEQALNLAESGIDQTLARIAKDPAYSNATALPGGVVEKSWALEQAASAPVQRGPEGDFVALKPPNRKVIYGVSWIPNREAPRRTRVVKAEYLLSSFNPNHAILVGGPLKLNGNPGVGGISGNVHANGPIDLTGNPQVSGDISTSGNYAGKLPSALPNPPLTWQAGAPEVQIPPIDPRAEWDRLAVANDEVWYDLCPDGKVRIPVFLPGDPVKPCGGQLAPGFVAGNEYRGFKLSGGNWDYSGNTAYDGIYYAYQRSIKVSGNPGGTGVTWKTTLYAEPGPDGATCPGLEGGDIEISGNPRVTPFLEGLTFMAGRDLKLNGNTNAASYDGVMMAKEQLSVPGNPTLSGSLIAEGLCNTPGSAVDQAFSDVSGNPTVTYNGDLEVKIGNIPRTTLWLEL